MLERFGHDLDTRVGKQTGELFANAARQFDPDDPSSPMSKHARELQKQQETLSATLERNHKDLASKVEELTTALKVTTSAREAAASTAKVTPLKGASYASEVHGLMEPIALGLGDEYADSGATPGTLASSKKGDGVLTINGGAARIVLEMTNSKRPNWNDYLEEAERNRNAAASLGLVREPSQNNGSTVRCLGSPRIVMAFDPATDDPELLRMVIQLLRISALSPRAAGRAAMKSTRLTRRSPRRSRHFRSRAPEPRVTPPDAATTPSRWSARYGSVRRSVRMCERARPDRGRLASMVEEAPPEWFTA